MSLPFVGEPVPEMLQRPRCAYCDKRRRPLIHTNHTTKEVPRTAYVRAEVAPGMFRMVSEPTGEVDLVPGFAVSREWRGTWHGYGAFCTTLCAVAFAQAAHAAGYRMVRK